MAVTGQQGSGKGISLHLPSEMSHPSPSMQSPALNPTPSPERLPAPDLEDAGAQALTTPQHSRQADGKVLGTAGTWREWTGSLVVSKRPLELECLVELEAGQEAGSPAIADQGRTSAEWSLRGLWAPRMKKRR